MSAESPLPGAHEVLEWWFGPGEDWPGIVQRNKRRWFEDGRSLDQEARERFGPLLDVAARGERDGWLETPRSALALVLVLDQLPRHVHRGEPEAFALDAAARATCEAALERGLDRRLSPVEQSFLYLPLEHAEDLDAQRRGVELMAGALERAPDELAQYMRSCVRFARAHLEVIERFGRFPHRNEALGRPSSRAERAYLERGGSRFGQ